jgi:hypothetical protein
MKIKPQKKNFYLNPIARLFLLATQLTKILIAGRGFGKSFVNGILILMYVASMPRSRGLFLGATYTQILTNTLLPIKSAWEWFGYYEGIDYVIGKRPPDYFKKPFMKPDRYDNIITFWNGTTVVLASMDRPELNRGGNNDWSVTDEALLIKREAYERNISPSIRGSHTSLKGKPGHLTESFTSSMPFGSVGTWLFDKMDEAKDPENDIYYILGNSWHNRKVLGDEVLKKWKRTMSPITYLIEVMNVRIRQYGNLFYPMLRDEHWYSDSYNYSYIDSLGYSISDKNKDSRWDKDCNKNMPLHISHDWGAFNCITIDQYHPDINTVKFLNYMYVSHPRIIDDLANDFCEYYKHHDKKVVYQWGDKAGNKKEANAKVSNFQQFAAILKKNKWRVIRMKTGDIPHITRHNFINKCHRDGHPVNIQYNYNNCNDLRIALESAGMSPDYKKDKRSENNDSVKPQHATHGTDAHDYRIYWGFYQHAEQKAAPAPVDIR